MHEYKQILESIEKESRNAMKKVDVDELKLRIAELTKLTQAGDFWQDQENAQKVSKELSAVSKEVKDWEGLATECAELLALFPDVNAVEDPTFADEFVSMVNALEKKWHSLEARTFLNGKYDKYSVIMSIHAGTGGKDAQDFAEMLMRMYMRYCERNGFEVEIFDKSMGEEVGLKSATLLIKGYMAYGYLKGEKGVHRLVRLSPFNAKNSRETSFAYVDIIPEIPESEIPEIRKEDLRVDTYRASGAGGQNVNKTSSAVRITHIPTGLVVACQDERSQLQNKERALKILHAKLMDLKEKQQVAEISELRGDRVDIAWGNQIRSYVMHPYTMVKDHRNGYEEGNVEAVLDGKIDGFLEAWLKRIEN